MKAHKGLDKQLQETAAAAVGVEKIKFQQLERVQPQHVLTLLATAAAAYFLIHQITQVKDLPAVLARMDWSWTILALVASALTYVGAGLNLIGGFVQRLSLGLTTAVQLGDPYQPHHPDEGRRHGGQRSLPAEAGAGFSDRDRPGWGSPCWWEGSCRSP